MFASLRARFAPWTAAFGFPQTVGFGFPKLPVSGFPKLPVSGFPKLPVSGDPKLSADPDLLGFARICSWNAGLRQLRQFLKFPVSKSEQRCVFLRNFAKLDVCS